MTCKDCIHYEACCHWTEEEHGAMEMTTTEQGCNYFKDKSKFIELPCKVGDTVYYINDFYDDSITIQEFIVESLHITADKDKLGRKKQSFALARDILYCFLPKRIPFTQFCKTVFLTREEAEKALKDVQE